jgi:hypothetical protein
MNRKLRLTLIACALGAASVTSAQTSDNVPPPNDVIRLPGNMTTPTMPVAPRIPTSIAIVFPSSLVSFFVSFVPTFLSFRAFRDRVL